MLDCGQVQNADITDRWAILVRRLNSPELSVVAGARLSRSSPKRALSAAAVAEGGSSSVSRSLQRLPLGGEA